MAEATKILKKWIMEEKTREWATKIHNKVSQSKKLHKKKETLWCFKWKYQFRAHVLTNNIVVDSTGKEDFCMLFQIFHQIQASEPTASRGLFVSKLKCSPVVYKLKHLSAMLPEVGWCRFSVIQVMVTLRGLNQGNSTSFCLCSQNRQLITLSWFEL